MNQQQQTDFYLREYEALRREIEFHLQHEQEREQYTVFAVAAVWAWLASTNLPPIYEWAWWIPFGVVVTGFVRHWMVSKHFGRLASYLITSEDRLEVKGWETFLASRPRVRCLDYFYHSLVWGLLLVATIVVPIVVLAAKPSSDEHHDKPLPAAPPNVAGEVLHD